MSGTRNNLPPTPGSWRTRPDYGDDGWNPNPAPYGRSLSLRGTQEASRSAPEPWWLSEPRSTSGSGDWRSILRIPMQPQPQPVQILVYSDGTRRELEPSSPQPQFIPDYPRQANYEEESRLSQEEQKKALKKLKKEVYTPTPKRITRRASLYYRDIKPISKEKEAMDEDGKRCAVCLEDFEAREEVMLTPCNHMFHEDCIVPWVKSHGQCPVCRAPFCDNTRSSSMPNNVVPNNMGGVADDLFAGELISIIRAMNEALEVRRLLHG